MPSTKIVVMMAAGCISQTPGLRVQPSEDTLNRDCDEFVKSIDEDDLKKFTILQISISN